MQLLSSGLTEESRDVLKHWSYFKIICSVLSNQIMSGFNMNDNCSKKCFKSMTFYSEVRLLFHGNDTIPIF